MISKRKDRHKRELGGKKIGLILRLRLAHTKERLATSMTSYFIQTNLANSQKRAYTTQHYDKEREKERYDEKETKGRCGSKTFKLSKESTPSLSK